MSVLMTLRVAGDATKLEKFAADDPAMLDGIIKRAKERGLISHRFWKTDTEVLVVDEWPTEEAFQGFFDSTPEIQQMMQAAGVTTHPEVTFWHPADIDDVYPPAK